MEPVASILFPTRNRRDYLAHALASVAGQAHEHGAEIVVVEDDIAHAPTERLAGEHGARYLALGAPAGLNAARNAGIKAARADLLCFLDDDVAVWPGWLAAILAGAAAYPEHEAFGGPIRAVLEDTDLHACGREPAPITTLDLGPSDRDAELVWGANLTLRRSALERVGAFDPVLSGPGDEEEWERRLRAAGGRIRYLAAAGVDHRRTGADAKVRALARAAWRQGRHARRFDVAKDVAPGFVRELRTFAGCVWHTARRRCGNGIVMAAHSAGRLREARAGGRRSEGGGTGPDYLSGQSGILGRRALAAGRVRDAVADVRATRQRRAVRRAAAEAPSRRVLVVGVARPGMLGGAIERELRASRHDVAVHLDPPAPGKGKWANLRVTLAAHPPGDADWLLVADDDVVLPAGFLDAFLLVAERAGLRLAQPAHAFASHAAWPVTRRRPGSLARLTRFVEIGPVTAIHRDAYPVLLPFPELEMGWGLDAHWSAKAADAGLALGVVDATPVRHVRPIAEAYPRAAAEQEAARYLEKRPYVTRDQAAETLATITTL